MDGDVRRIALATREAVERSVDVDTALTTFHTTRRRRRRARILAGLVVVSAVATGAAALTSTAFTPQEAPAATEPRPSPPVRDHCTGSSAVRCLDHSLFLVEGRTHYSFALPQAFSSELDVGHAPDSLDIYRRTPGVDAGVTIFQSPAAVGRAVGAMTARDLAHWVASRRFLESTPLERAAVGGRPAWRLDTRLVRGQRWPLAQSCNASQPDCRPLLHQPIGGNDWETGPWSSMVSRYTFVDAPDGETLVIWSWAFRSDTEALAVNDRLVRTIAVLTPG